MTKWFIIPFANPVFGRANGSVLHDQIKVLTLLHLQICKEVNMSPRSTRAKRTASEDKRPSRFKRSQKANSHTKQLKSGSSKPKIAPEERKVIILNKPFDTLSQFTDGEGRKTLADYISTKGVYAAGRLDRDSEGFLLTNDGILQTRLTQPSSKSPKTYWVQVDGSPSEVDLDKLRQGVELRWIDATSESRSHRRAKMATHTPVRFRANIPTTWLSITIIEGRNRQVRPMIAHRMPNPQVVRYSVACPSMRNRSGKKFNCKKKSRGMAV